MLHALVRSRALFKESGGRIAYLTAEQEAAIFEALPVELRPYSSPA